MEQGGEEEEEEMRRIRKTDTIRERNSDSEADSNTTIVVFSQNKLLISSVT